MKYKHSHLCVCVLYNKYIQCKLWKCKLKLKDKINIKNVNIKLIYYIYYYCVVCLMWCWSMSCNACLHMNFACPQGEDQLTGDHSVSADWRSESIITNIFPHSLQCSNFEQFRHIEFLVLHKFHCVFFLCVSGFLWMTSNMAGFTWFWSGCPQPHNLTDYKRSLLNLTYIRLYYIMQTYAWHVFEF